MHACMHRSETNKAWQGVEAHVALKALAEHEAFHGVPGALCELRALDASKRGRVLLRLLSACSGNHILHTNTHLVFVLATPTHSSRNLPSPAFGITVFLIT
jgi:hypothetical protein